MSEGAGEHLPLLSWAQRCEYPSGPEAFQLCSNWACMQCSFDTTCDPGARAGSPSEGCVGHFLLQKHPPPDLPCQRQMARASHYDTPPNSPAPPWATGAAQPTRKAFPSHSAQHRWPAMGLQPHKWANRLNALGRLPLRKKVSFSVLLPLGCRSAPLPKQDSLTKCTFHHTPRARDTTQPLGPARDSRHLPRLRSGERLLRVRGVHYCGPQNWPWALSRSTIRLFTCSSAREGDLLVQRLPVPG